MIPCTDTCRWQQGGECTLDVCDNAVGQPSTAHPCAHYLPISPAPAAAALRRYSPPEAAPDRQEISDP